MKKIILSLLLLAPSLSFAGSTIRLPAPCYTALEISKVVQEYNEVVVATATSIRFLSDGTATYTPLLVFANPTTGSYTIVEQHVGGDKPYCVISAGESYESHATKISI